jgi:poly(hydroxyalkanoate) depolymerase family esterase
MSAHQDRRRPSAPRHLKRLLAFAALAIAMLAACSARAASWKTSVNYGTSGIAMDLYVPDGITGSPAIVVSLHYCGGTASNAHGWFQSYADQYKFIIIAPKSAGSCFDAGLGRTGERANIAAMVKYVVTNNNADPKKVYASGPSSGACMTQALLASYPDVFAGGSSLAGVPAGAWTGGGAYGWSAPASTTAQQWGDKVRNADPGFNGPRPRIQFWQGMGDTNLTYSQTYPAQLAQWTNVFAVGDAQAMKQSIKPSGASNTWARTSYMDCSGLEVVEANSGPSNVVHDLTPEGLWGDVVRFFGLASGGTVAGGPCTGTTGTGGAGGGAGGMGGSTAGAGGAGGGAAGRGGSAAGGRGGAGGSVGAGGSSAGAGGSARGGNGGPGTGGSSGPGTGGSVGPGTGGSVGPGTGGNSGPGTGGSSVVGTGGSSGPGTGGTGSPVGTGGSSGPGSGGTGSPVGSGGNGAAGSGSGGDGTISGAAGSSGSAGTTGETGGPEGCACGLGGGGAPSGIAALLIAALGLIVRRRTRRRN